jgi:hypothetical protein
MKDIDDKGLAIVPGSGILGLITQANSLTSKATTCMKALTRIALLGSLFLVPALAHAQNGCVNSPECPTAVLGLIGAAGAALFTRFRSR